MIFDTSGLIAALDPDDRQHAPASRVVLASTPPRVLSPYVLAELDYMLRERLGAAATRTALTELGSGSYELAAVDADELLACVAFDERHEALELGLADASIVVLAQRFRTTEVLTLDHRHFRALRPLQGGSFRLLPADG